MQLENISTDFRLLVGALVLPFVVACDSGVSVVPSGGSTAVETDPVVEVVGDPVEDVDPTQGSDGVTVGDVLTPECVDSPPVGDGWGWNGTESCQVGGTTDTTTGTDNTEETGVETAECIDTAPVGDGFGWNGTESCQVGGTPIVSDPGTGTPTDSFTQVSAESITDLILVTGQSNALGAGTSFDALLDAPDTEVMAYTNQGWQVANLNQVWDRNWFPRNDPNTPPSNNFGLHFGKRVADRTTNRVVGLILLTSPGSAISDWGPNSPLFNSIRDKVSLAINETPFKSRIDGILWHQGESDGEDRDEYSAALYDLISRFRSEPWFDDGRPFICGETASAPVNNQLNRLNTDADIWTSCVEAEGLAVLPGTDHFNASSLRTIGQRYADEYVRMWLGIE